MPESSQPKIFVTRRIPASGLDRLASECQVELWEDPLPPPRDVLLEKIAGCDGVLTLLTEQVNAEFFEAAGPQLKVVSNYAVGFNNIDVPEATSRGIRVGNTPGVLTDATADMAVTLMLCSGRRIVEAEKHVQAGNWKTWEPLGFIGTDLHGKTLGIVGMGRIGTSVARRCHRGWDMPIIYHDQFANESAEKELDALRVDFDQLIRQSDFISVHTVLDDSTRGMFNREVFQQMKSTAVFVNTARGPLHVQSDLYEALKAKEIFAAGLDVTDPEPIDVDDPLLTLPNCVVVPHIASATVSSRNGMAEIAADNLLAGLRGEPLRCWVNPDAGQS